MTDIVTVVINRWSVKMEISDFHLDAQTLFYRLVT